MPTKQIKRGLGLLAIFLGLFWSGSPLVGQGTPFRLINPQSVTGNSSGWKVTPATGSLGWSLPVGVVPGDIPIPVVYRYQASVMSDRTQSVTGYTYNPDGTSTPHYIDVQRYRGIWGALHFGFITPATGTMRGVHEDGTQVLEDGTLFRDSEWYAPAPDGSSLPTDFKFNAPAGGYLMESSGTYGLYSASLTDLGTWSTKVSQLTSSTQFKVLMDRERARVYAYQAALQTYVPVLWVDRFGHWVTFQWNQGTWSGMVSFTVKALNQNGTGVQVAWAIQSGSSNTVVDLLRADFIGVSAPSLLVRGYWGTSASLPSAMGTPFATLVPLPLAVGGPVGRPTLIRMGTPSDLYAPGYVVSLPTPPVATALEVDWTFGYLDPNLAELNRITDPMGVTTTFTFQTTHFPSEIPYLRGVTSATSLDSVTGVSRSQNWSYAIPTTNGNWNWATTYTEGYSDGAATESRSVEYGFSTINAAVKSVTIRGGAGNNQTTTYGLTSSGQDGTLTVPNGTHVTATGKPNVDVTATLMAKTALPSGIYLSVGGVPVQSTSTLYNTLPQYLDQAQPTSTTVTRSNLATGGNLPSVVTTATYTTKGLPTKNSLQAGGQEKGQTYTYDTDGRLTKTGTIASWATDISLSMAYTPSPFGPTSATTSGTNISPSLSQAWGYKDTGAVATTTNAQGIATTYTYDLRGRLLTVQRTGDPLLTYTYSGERKRTWGQGRVSGSESYDGFGRLQAKLRADGVTENYTYDTYGRLVTVQEAGTLGGSTRPVSQTQYDALGRLISKTPASGPGATYTYSANGTNQVVTISTNGLTYTQTSDPWGQMVTSTDPRGTTTTTVYNEFGQVKQVTQSNGGVNQVRTFNYDGIGNLLSRKEPETGTTTFATFNAQGLPASITNSARTLSISYDALGRRRSVTNGGNSLGFTYTGAFLTGATSSNGVSQGFVYNGPGGRLSSESLTIDGVVRTVGYGYDGYGTLGSITYPSGRAVGYGYDAMNRVNQITNNGATLATVGYGDGWGNRTSMTFASGAISQWTPDPLGLHLLNWTVNYTGGGDSRAYGYDTSDHLKQVGEWTVVHDKLGRLTSASGLGVGASYMHDGFGNNTAVAFSTSAPATFNAFGFNPLTDNRIPTAQPNGVITGWAYPDNGEASQIETGISTGRYLSMTWDAFGRLGGVTDSLTTAVQNYRYTPSGMRVGLTDTSDSTRNRQYAYTGGGLLLGEYLGSGAWKRDVIYLGGQAIAEVDGNGVHELHLDPLGTPRVITKGSGGAVEGRQAYGPYGELIGASTYGYQPLTGYTGHAQTDPTGLIYMRGRFYSPAWHRFLNSDQGLDPRSPNQYAYVGGSPFTAIDPSGMSFKETMDDFFNWLFGQTQGADTIGGLPCPEPQTNSDPFYGSPGGGFIFGGRQGDLFGLGVFNGVIHEYDIKRGYSKGWLAEGWVGNGLNGGIGKITTVEAPSEGLFVFGGGNLSAGPAAGLQTGIVTNFDWIGGFIEGHEGKLGAGGGIYINPSYGTVRSDGQGMGWLF